MTHGVRPSNLWPSFHPLYPKYPYLLITKHMGHQWSISCSLSAHTLSLTKIILSVSALSKIEVVRPDLVYVQRDLRFFSFVIGVLCIFKLSAMSTSICFHFCTLFVWNIIFLGWNCSLLKYYACIWSLMAKSGVLFAGLFFWYQTDEMRIALDKNDDFRRSSMGYD